MFRSFNVKTALAGLLLVSSVAGAPVEPRQPHPSEDVFWGPGGTDPVKEKIPPGAKLTFFWSQGVTVNEDGVEVFEPHRGFGKYEETNEALHVTKVRYMHRPVPAANDPAIMDWHQTIEWKDGSSVVVFGKIEREPGGDRRRSIAASPGPWEFHPLSEMAMNFRIPDLAPMNADPTVTIYTAVNASLYQSRNPYGFLNGNWAFGQTLDQLGLTITNGQMEGVEGIYWATTPFVFDRHSITGFVPSDPNSWLNYGPQVSELSNSLAATSSYAYTVGIIGAHESVPEPTTTTLTGIGLAATALAFRRRRKRNV